MTQIPAIPGIGPGTMRALGALVFAAGLCFALSGICDLLSLITSPQRPEP